MMYNLTMRNLTGLEKGRGLFKGTKGVLKSNSGSFKKGRIATNKKTWIEKVCPQCGENFSVKPSLMRIMCCSQSCSMRRRGSPNKGKSLTNEHRKALSGPRENTRGPNSHRWIEDRSKIKRSEKKHEDVGYRIWMKSVKERDGWKCRISDEDCKGRLEAHHILNWIDYPELRYEINNGISLCQAHHPRGRAKEKRLVAEFQALVSAPIQTL